MTPTFREPQELKLITEFLDGAYKHTTTEQPKGCETWTRTEVLREDSLSRVYKERCAENEKLRAVKEVKRSQFIQRQLPVLARLRLYPEHFEQLIGWFEDGYNIYLAMEYLPHDLDQLLKDWKISEDGTKRVTKQILAALEIIHNEGICHRDLKPRNILVARRVPISVRIAGFDVSKDNKGMTEMRTTVGTAPFMAPEIWGFLDSESGPYTTAVDIWSLGCLVYYMITNTIPFSGPRNLLNFLTGGGSFPPRSASAQSIPQLAIEFMSRLLQPLPDNRVPASRAQLDPWLLIKEQSDTLWSTLSPPPSQLASEGPRIFAAPDHEFKLNTEFIDGGYRHVFKTPGRRPRIETWSRKKLLAEGTSGDIYEEECAESGAVRAVKMVRRTVARRDELDIMVQLRGHPQHFVRFDGWFEDDRHIYFAMELLGRNLEALIKDHHPTEHDARVVTSQVLEGLEIMHSMGLCHRDIKPSNILLFELVPLAVKIADFGVSKHFDSVTVEEEITGTRNYMAPEVLGFGDSSTASGYTTAVDLWSLGCLVYYMMTRSYPFPEVGDLVAFVEGKSTFPPSYPPMKVVPPLAVNFMTSLIKLSPLDRPSAEKARQHPWLSTLTDQQDVETRELLPIISGTANQALDRITHLQLATLGNSTVAKLGNGILERPGPLEQGLKIASAAEMSLNESSIYQISPVRHFPLLAPPPYTDAATIKVQDGAALSSHPIATADGNGDSMKPLPHMRTDVLEMNPQGLNALHIAENLNDTAKTRTPALSVPGRPNYAGVESARYRLETTFEPDGISVVHTTHLRCQPPTTGLWTTIRTIGRGANGVVTLQSGPSGRLRAVKHVLEPASYAKEVIALTKVSDRHDLFVEFYGWYEDRNFLYIAMEYVENGDLGAYLKKFWERPLPEETCREVARQLLRGLEVLHERQICHRDLKPQNILMASLDPIRIKITDFGASKYLKDTQFKTRVGTQGYAAPEVLGIWQVREGRVILGYAVDLWAAGCIIWEVLTSRGPFQLPVGDTEEVISGLDCEEEVPEINTLELIKYCQGQAGLPIETLKDVGVSTEAAEVVSGLLSPDPSNRASASESLQLPWLLRPAPFTLRDDIA